MVALSPPLSVSVVKAVHVTVTYVSSVWASILEHAPGATGTFSTLVPAVFAGLSAP